jgi:hypothetical protein
MPCYDGRDSPVYLSAEICRLQQTVDQNARMLCSVCKVVERELGIEAIPANARVWWRMHKADDEKREERTRVAAAKKRKEREEKKKKKREKAIAVSRLDVDEAAALGIGKKEYWELIKLLDEDQK